MFSIQRFVFLNKSIFLCKKQYKPLPFLFFIHLLVNIKQYGKRIEVVEKNQT